MRSMRVWEWPDPYEVGARLLSAIIAHEMQALDAPHVVVCRTVGGGLETFSGPYPSVVEALAVAERDAREEEAAGNFDLQFDVAPLLPPAR